MTKEEKYQIFRRFCRDEVESCGKCPLRNSKVCTMEKGQVKEHQLDYCLELIKIYKEM